MYVNIGRNKKVKFTELSVTIKLNAVASTFNMRGVKDGISLLEEKVYIYTDEGQLILAGWVVDSTDKETPVPEESSISGYSFAGILEDVDVHPDDYPLQVNNVNLEDIIRRYTGRYTEIGYAVFGDDFELTLQPFQTVKISPTEKLKSLINRLTIQRGLFLSHLADGTLLLISDVLAQSKKIKLKKIWDFVLTGNIRNIHSPVSVHLQSDENVRGQVYKAVNPFVKGERPISVQMKDGEQKNMQAFAKKIIASEMLNIKAECKTDEFINIKTVFDYKGFEWIVTESHITESENKPTYKLTLCLKSVYSDKLS